MFLTMTVKVASAEMSFLKHYVKRNYLRSTINQEQFYAVLFKYKMWKSFMLLQYFLMCYDKVFSSDVNKYRDFSFSFFIIVSVAWHHITFRTHARKSANSSFK
jgi:hypothetical protein